MVKHDRGIPSLHRTPNKAPFKGASSSHRLCRWSLTVLLIFSLSLSCKTYGGRYIPEDAAHEAGMDISNSIMAGNIAVINISSQRENESCRSSGGWKTVF
jgi:hypothetical protein